MSVRARLLLAFAYVVVSVTAALSIPLAVNLQRRGETELRANALAQGQAIAALIGRPRADARLARTVEAAADAAEGRVIVVDADGVLVADSAGPGLLGERYATAERPEIVRALRDGVPESRMGRSDTLDEEILATAVPVTERGTVVGAVRITQSLAPARAQARRALLGVAVIAAVGLGVGLLLAVLLARSLARPLRVLADAARRAGAGDLSARAGPLGGATEIARVAEEFDRMAARVEEIVLARARFAADASHQLRTPLTGLRLRLESAVDQAPTLLRADLEAAEAEARRLGDIVERLLVLSRRLETGEREEVDLAAAARAAAARWAGPADQAEVAIEVDAADARAVAAGDDVQQILDNLIDNAVRYGGRRVLVATRSAGSTAELTVEDDGPGIPEQDRARVLERFARGRDAPSGGSGLGLSIARELAERWGGDVAVGESQRGGARVRVRFPAV